MQSCLKNFPFTILFLFIKSITGEAYSSIDAVKIYISKKLEISFKNSSTKGRFRTFIVWNFPSTFIWRVMSL